MEGSLLDGFYVGYMTATSGYGVVLFVFQGDVIVGVDAGGVKFDGKFVRNTESGDYQGDICVEAPPNISLVQGISSGPSGVKYTVPFSLPSDFLSYPFIKVETPFGAVNVKLEKLRDLADTQ